MDNVKNQGNICQSCGMPLAKEEDHGTEADGGQNSEYCHFCYMNGAFTAPDATLEQWLEKNIQIAKHMGMSEDDAVNLAHNVIPNLKRWKQ